MYIAIYCQIVFVEIATSYTVTSMRHTSHTLRNLSYFLILRQKLFPEPSVSVEFCLVNMWKTEQGSSPTLGWLSWTLCVGHPHEISNDIHVNQVEGLATWGVLVCCGSGLF